MPSSHHRQDKIVLSWRRCELGLTHNNTSALRI